MNPIENDPVRREAHSPETGAEAAPANAMASGPDIGGYEDGLVHEHNWACRERGAKAHH